MRAEAALQSHSTVSALQPRTSRNTLYNVITYCIKGECTLWAMIGLLNKRVLGRIYCRICVVIGDFRQGSRN